MILFLGRTALVFAAVGIILPSASAADPAPAVQWRTDYNAARREAAEKNLPILMEITSDNCYHCRRLEATTLRDSNITATLQQHFLALRINGEEEQNLCRLLRVTAYPTLIIANSDGKIHATL
ncbi:MAG: thioredoxin family protein, partial [Gemmataceae bacterium]